MISSFQKTHETQKAQGKKACQETKQSTEMDSAMTLMSELQTVKLK